MLLSPRAFMCVRRAAELLISFPEGSAASPHPDAQRQSPGGADAPTPSPSTTPSPSLAAEGTPEAESDRVTLGRLYLDSKEYRRAAHALQNETGPLAFFLRNYALLLVSTGRPGPPIRSLLRGPLFPVKGSFLLDSLGPF